MNQIYVDFLNSIKKSFINNEYEYVIINKDTNNFDSNNIDLYQEITSYILYLWYSDTNDSRISEKNYVLKPLNLKRTFYFDKIEFLDIAKILSYIKYNLLNGVLDILNQEKFNKKNLKKFKTNELRNVINEKTLNPNKNLKTKADIIDFLLNNKTLIFNTCIQNKKKIKIIKRIKNPKIKIIKKKVIKKIKSNEIKK